MEIQGMESLDEEDKITLCSQVNVQVKVTKIIFNIITVVFS